MKTLSELEMILEGLGAKNVTCTKDEERGFIVVRYDAEYDHWEDPVFTMISHWEFEHYEEIEAPFLTIPHY